MLMNKALKKYFFFLLFKIIVPFSFSIYLDFFSQFIVPGLCRSLRDGFPHARAASLASLLSNHFKFKPELIAQKIVPAVIPLTLDPDRNVRQQV